MGFRDPLRSVGVANPMPRYFYNSAVLLLISLLPIGARGLAGADAPYPSSTVIGPLARGDELVQCGRSGSGDNWPIAWVDGPVLEAPASGGGPRLSIGLTESHGDPLDVAVACVSKRRIADRMDCESCAVRDGAGRWVWDCFHADFAGWAVERACRRSTEWLKLNSLWLPLSITKAPSGHASRVRFDYIVVARECISPITPIAIQR